MSKPEQGDLPDSCFEFPQIPAVFTFSLKSDTHTMRPQVCPHCAEPLRSESLGATWGFGWLVSALEGSQCDFGTKGEVWTWYPHSVLQTATSFTHSVVSSRSLWLHRPCANLFWTPPFTLNVTPCPRGTDLVSLGQYSAMDTDWALKLHFPFANNIFTCWYKQHKWPLIYNLAKGMLEKFELHNVLLCFHLHVGGSH